MDVASKMGGRPHKPRPLFKQRDQVDQHYLTWGWVISLYFTFSLEHMRRMNLIKNHVIYIIFHLLKIINNLNKLAWVTVYSHHLKGIEIKIPFHMKKSIWSSFVEYNTTYMYLLYLGFTLDIFRVNQKKIITNLRCLYIGDETRHVRYISATISRVHTKSSSQRDHVRL